MDVHLLSCDSVYLLKKYFSSLWCDSFLIIISVCTLCIHTVTMTV